MASTCLVAAVADENHLDPLYAVCDIDPKWRSDYGCIRKPKLANRLGLRYRPVAGKDMNRSGDASVQHGAQGVVALKRVAAMKRQAQSCQRVPRAKRRAKALRRLARGW